jgi:hypothetical protein
VALGNKRQSLTKKIRFEVFKRDSFRCQYCGASAPEALLVIDHIKPVAEGGTNDLLNLITACQPCNAGKGKRELSDNSVIAKQSDQLRELSERREQLEMMIQWKEGLSSLKGEVEERLANHWSKLAREYGLNETGKQSLRKLTSKYEVGEIMDAMQIAADQYLTIKDGKVEQASVEEAWAKVPGICRVRRSEKDKPYLRELLYIRGILRNRMYVPESRIMQMLEDSHLAGVPLEEIQRLAKTCRNWTQFQDELYACVDDCTAPGGEI